MALSELFFKFCNSLVLLRSGISHLLHDAPLVSQSVPQFIVQKLRLLRKIKVSESFLTHQIKQKAPFEVSVLEMKFRQDAWGLTYSK